MMVFYSIYTYKRKEIKLTQSELYVCIGDNIHLWWSMKRGEREKLKEKGEIKFLGYIYKYFS